MIKYRVVVADDEDIIRRGIVQLVDWDKLQCQVVKECVDGNEVLAFLKESQADIVITDIKMPGMDGIELMKSIYEQCHQVQTIILTAYSDFDYIKKALRYGVVDFVVKNDFIEELPKAVEAAAIRCEKSREEREKAGINEEEHKSMQGYILESLALSRVLNDSEDIVRYGLNDRVYCVCRCEITFLEEKMDSHNTVQMLKSFLGAVINKHPYYIVNIQSNGMTLIVSESRKIGLDLRDITSMCGEVLQIVEEFMRVNIKFGISSITNDVYGLPVAFQESVKALSRSADSGNEIVVYVEEPKTVSTPNLDSYISAMMDSVFSKHPEQAKEQMEKMKQSIIDCRYPFSKSKIKIINLCSALFRRLGDFYVSDKAENLENQFYNQISKSTMIYTLFQVCGEMLEEVGHLTGNRMEKHYLIDQIDRFIRQNYQNNITLQDIADAVHVSSAYVSRLYRNKTGITITEAINNIRIEQAKLLLEQSSCRVYEVAQQVGFEDAAYFTNVFTKRVGCSPSEYRNHK